MHTEVHSGENDDQDSSYMKREHLVERELAQKESAVAVRSEKDADNGTANLKREHLLEHELAQQKYATAAHSGKNADKDSSDMKRKHLLEHELAAHSLADAVRRDTLKGIRDFVSMQHTATHCNTLQHTLTGVSELSLYV